MALPVLGCTIMDGKWSDLPWKKRQLGLHDHGWKWPDFPLTNCQCWLSWSWLEMVQLPLIKASFGHHREMKMFASPLKKTPAFHATKTDGKYTRACLKISSGLTHLVALLCCYILVTGLLQYITKCIFVLKKKTLLAYYRHWLISGTDLEPGEPCTNLNHPL